MPGENFFLIFFKRGLILFFVNDFKIQPNFKNMDPSLLKFTEQSNQVEKLNLDLAVKQKNSEECFSRDDFRFVYFK